MKRFISLTLTLMLCMGLFTACGAGSSDSYESAGDTKAPEQSYQDDMGTGSQTTADMLKPQDDRKIIYNASIDLESKQFDETLALVMEAAQKANAYIQSSEESGDQEYGSRWVRYTFRVPCQNYRDFMNGASEAGNLLSRSESTQDVTAEYVDVEARLESLEAQESRLKELSAQAQTLEDLLVIEDHLSSVQYEIESFTGQKNLMDNLVSYSTVDVSLREVEILKPTDDSFGTRLKTACSESWVQFVEGLQGMIIALIYMLPSLLLLALIAVVIMLIVRFLRRNRKHPAARPQMAARPQVNVQQNVNKAEAEPVKNTGREPASYDQNQ